MSQRDFAESVARRLTEAGHRALFAGGCVRDDLLGRPPQDYDIATSARPEEVRRLFPHTVPVGVAFGVVLVLGPRPAPDAPPVQIEVATFRTDEGYSDGRRPDAVRFSDEVEDARRRDFTVNALFRDPLTGEVLDYVGGRADLARRCLRAVGDPLRRFQEDRLRMLRAVRFAAALDFDVDPLTFAAVKREAEHIKEVAVERVQDELARMLTGPNPRRALELLKSSRLLKQILPEVDALAGVEQPPQFHPEGDVWTHTLLMLGELHDAPLTLALGVLLHDVGKPPTFQRLDRIRFNEHDQVGREMTEAILRRLRFPNEVVERVAELVGGHMLFMAIRQMRPARFKRFLRLPHFEEHLELHRLDCRASHGSLEDYEFCKRQCAALSREVLRPAPLITGDDLIALGLTPGPLFKQVLAEVEELQLGGELKDRDAALAHVRGKYASGKQP